MMKLKNESVTELTMLYLNVKAELEILERRTRACDEICSGCKCWNADLNCIRREAEECLLTTDAIMSDVLLESEKASLQKKESILKTTLLLARLNA